MIIEAHTYYALCAVIFLLGTIPLVHVVYKKQVDKWWYTLVFFFLFVLFIQSTPVVYTIEGCGFYKKGRLIFPKGDLWFGENAYVVNESTSMLFLESVGYGEVDYSESLLGEEEIILEAGEFMRLPLRELDYVLSRHQNV